jgi:hypothetical protein
MVERGGPRRRAAADPPLRLAGLRPAAPRQVRSPLPPRRVPGAQRAAHHAPDRLPALRGRPRPRVRRPPRRRVPLGPGAAGAGAPHEQRGLPGFRHSAAPGRAAWPRRGAAPGGAGPRARRGAGLGALPRHARHLGAGHGLRGAGPPRGGRGGGPPARGARRRGAGAALPGAPRNQPAATGDARGLGAPRPPGAPALPVQRRGRAHPGLPRGGLHGAAGAARGGGDGVSLAGQRALRAPAHPPPAVCAPGLHLCPAVPGEGACASM